MCKISEMNLETAKYYGYEAQSNQLVEECAELIQAVNKYRRVQSSSLTAMQDLRSLSQSRSKKSIRR